MPGEPDQPVRARAVRINLEPPGQRQVISARFVWPFRILLYGALINAALWGGPVIRAAALCAVPLALLYDLGGGFRHLAHIAGLTLAVWLATVVPGWLDRILPQPRSPALAAVPGLGAVLALIVALVLAWWAGRRGHRRLRRRPVLNGLDRVLGSLLGVAEGALIVALGCWLLAAFSTPVNDLRASFPEQAGFQARLLEGFSDLDADVQDDAVGRWLARHNPLESLEIVQAGQVALEVAGDPEALLRAVDAGRLDELARLPELEPYVQAARKDPALVEAVQRRDLPAVLNDPTVQAMLKDPKLHRALLAHFREVRSALHPEAVAPEPPDNPSGPGAAGNPAPADPPARFRVVDDLRDAYPEVGGERRP